MVRLPGLPNFLSMVASEQAVSPTFIWVTGGIGTRSLNAGAAVLPPGVPTGPATAAASGLAGGCACAGSAGCC